MSNELTMSEQLLLKNTSEPGASLSSQLHVLAMTNPDDSYTIFKKVYTSLSPLDLHFICNSLQASLYKKRAESDDNISKAKEVCLLDYDLVKSGTSKLSYQASMPCIERLIAIYEKEQNIDAALEVCQFALEKQIVGNYVSKKVALLKKTSFGEKTPSIQQIKDKPDADGFYPLEYQYIQLLNDKIKSINGPVAFDFSKRSDGRLVIQIRGELANHSYSIFIKNITMDEYSKLIENIPVQISEFSKQVDYFYKMLRKG